MQISHVTVTAWSENQGWSFWGRSYRFRNIQWLRLRHRPNVSHKSTKWTHIMDLVQKNREYNMGGEIVFCWQIYSDRMRWYGKLSESSKAFWGTFQCKSFPWLNFHTVQSKKMGKSILKSTEHKNEEDLQWCWFGERSTYTYISNKYDIRQYDDCRLFIIQLNILCNMLASNDVCIECYIGIPKDECGIVLIFICKNCQSSQFLMQDPETKIA